MPEDHTRRDDFPRKHMKLIADQIAGDITTVEQYCSGTRSFDWRTGASLDLPPHEYERDLSEFLLSDPAGISKQGLDALVVIGGIGTGKSTTLKQLIRIVREQPRVCSAAGKPGAKCLEVPVILDLNIADIIGESGRRVADKERAKLQLGEFWNIAASRVAQVFASTQTFEDEVKFWAWALDGGSLHEHSRLIHRWLNEHEHQIRSLAAEKPYRGWSLDALSQNLERQRADLMTRLADKDLVWYRVFQLAHALTASTALKCRCRYVFLDNVDQLEPQVQRDVVDFVILLSDVLHARTLIAIRPLTWTRSVHAHMLVRTQNHFSPALRDVLLARLKRLAGHPLAPPDLVAYLRQVVFAFTAANSLWGELFEATSGLSVRFAIRNFLNLIQSPLLPPLSSSHDPLAHMRASEIARAFFFGEGENVLYDNLENLYALGTDMRREYRLIKARILDYLIRVCELGATEVEQLTTTLAKFGYTNAAILKALNDLLIPTRPLLWSQEGHQIGNLTSQNKIAVTPVGRGYHANLFGQLYYDEVCIARSRSEVVPLERVFEFHGELWEQDKHEIRQAVRRHGPGFYRTLYPAARPGISAIHAINLREGVEKRSVDPPIGYDAQRLDFITQEVEKLLSVRW
jgi:hypothetical protein